jgi:nitroimidazol reductase NimA-like FMN-containing flavoprotein (pyridoxamine 5'-phosphate oxidase superfamily)
MRKKEKEITEKTAIEAVVRKSLVCRLGLSDGNTPTLCLYVLAIKTAQFMSMALQNAKKSIF